MELIEVAAVEVVAVGVSAQPPRPARPKPPRRPWPRRAMHAVRRGHLYCGLFLLPWVLLYGVTAFLFNHPAAFSDQPTTAVDRGALSGTPMESPPAPAAVAAEVTAALQKRAKPGVTYTLVEPGEAKYTREFAFATVKADGQEVNVLLDVTGAGGTVRSRPPQAPPPPPVEAAPFAISGRGGPGAGGAGGRGAAGAGKGGERGGGPANGKGGERGGGAPGGKGGERGGQRGAPETLAVESPLHERVKATVPVVLERTGFPGGEVTVTSVPDLAFLMSDGEKTWRVTYNALTGSVAGKPADEPSTGGTELSTRRFLLRLHTTHGYPSEVGSRWVWCVIVDVMAFVMVFWGLSGILMWWQIKATRWVGAAVVVLSLIAAAALTTGMHEAISTAGR